MLFWHQCPIAIGCFLNVERLSGFFFQGLDLQLHLQNVGMVWSQIGRGSGILRAQGA